MLLLLSPPTQMEAKQAPKGHDDVSRGSLSVFISEFQLSTAATATDDFAFGFSARSDRNWTGTTTDVGEERSFNTVRVKGQRKALRRDPPPPAVPVKPICRGEISKFPTQERKFDKKYCERGDSERSFFIGNFL